jgi:hypothetical protein
MSAMYQAELVTVFADRLALHWIQSARPSTARDLRRATPTVSALSDAGALSRRLAARRQVSMASMGSCSCQDR